MHLRNLEDLFYIDKVLEEGGVFLWRRRHSEPSTDTCINPYIVLNVRVGFRRFQPIAVARRAWIFQLDFVEHTVCRARSYSSVADTQRLSLTRHSWVGSSGWGGSQDPRPSLRHLVPHFCWNRADISTFTNGHTQQFPCSYRIQPRWHVCFCICT